MERSSHRTNGGALTTAAALVVMRPSAEARLVVLGVGLGALGSMVLRTLH